MPMSGRKDETLVEIGKRLRGQGEAITHEPLPRRWVDLIHHLDEQERKRSQHQRAGPKSGPAKLSGNL
jgi:hypothetical protein